MYTLGRNVAFLEHHRESVWCLFPPAARSVLVKVSDLVFSFARILATFSHTQNKKISAKRRPSSSSSSSSSSDPWRSLQSRSRWGFNAESEKEVRGVAYFPESDQSGGFGVGAGGRRSCSAFFFLLLLFFFPTLPSPHVSSS